VESPSTRSWLGVGAALSALPAAGGCLCAALLLAVVADSDPGAVYEQHRWLGAVVAACAVCAFVAMMGWATLRHGGVRAPVLLVALVVAGAPFVAPGVRARFGGYDARRLGYGRTVASSPEAVRVVPDRDGATVALTLRAGDRDACGRVGVRRFAVTWRLARAGAGWLATAATARTLSRHAPAATC
jgi:hypothetical protein